MQAERSGCAKICSFEPSQAKATTRVILHTKFETCLSCENGKRFKLEETALIYQINKYSAPHIPIPEQPPEA